MIGSTFSRFKTEDCVECDDIVEDALPCDFTEGDTCKCCGKMACRDCFREVWKECPDCGRRGCRGHFEGMYCKECIEEQRKDYTEGEEE